MDSAALSELRGAISVVKQSWNKCAGAVPALLCREYSEHFVIPM